jgi:uncharacterized protein (TIGR00255 family)
MNNECMVKSMTGFGRAEVKAEAFGSIVAELRSTNHKALEIIVHVPDGFIALEGGIKNEIESQVQRGRITCVVNIVGGRLSKVFINKPLLKEYLLALKRIKSEFRIQDAVSLDTLIHLPGVLALAENTLEVKHIIPHLKVVIRKALSGLIQMRRKEGKVLALYLNARIKELQVDLNAARARFKKALDERLARIDQDEERASFLKNTDVSEEISRLAFHANNFRDKLKKRGPVGKELDFIAQEMQREANTMAAKSFDTLVSSRVIQIKGQVEKIREQVQNIE